MSRALRIGRRAAVAFSLISLTHLCYADTGTVASANPYATIRQNGPLNQDSFTCPVSLSPQGCTLDFDYWVTAQCYSPQANPQNWPNNTGSLITYNPGAYIYDDISLSGQIVYSGPGPVNGTEDDPSASASVSNDGMQVVFTYTQYPSQTCTTNPLFPLGIWCSTSPVSGNMTLLDCTGPTVNVNITCPSNQVPSTNSPWNNGCGCSGGDSCVVDFSDPNSMCNCSGGGGTGDGGGGDGGDCGDGDDGDCPDFISSTCSTDSCGNPCGATQPDGSCDSSGCSSSACACDMGSSCNSAGCGTFNCDGTCNESGCGNGDGGDACGGCPAGEECSSYDFMFPICQPDEDPILIDLSGNGFSMTDPKGGVKFDFYGNGKPHRIAWTAAGAQNGWLALDLNHNGKIDNGEELFSNVTPQPGLSAQHLGFKALAQYDDPKFGGNGDGVIDARDAIYSRLLIWVDKNHNGVTDPGELMTLKGAGIKSIAVNYEDAHYTDLYGNQFRYRAQVVWTEASKNARQGWAYDVVLITPPPSGGR